ncbi:MAG: hypothetical protein KGZ52_08150 [Xanthomonadaceae bacterium]|nr:hypothetical protein [Xanthomonadaceae bacterium]
MRPASSTYTPWSFVLPIAVGVLLGVLLADLVRLGFAAVAARQAAEVFQHELERIEQQAETLLNGGSAPPSLPVYPHPLATAPLGSLACSGGAILQRIENGWAQVRVGRDKCIFHPQVA